MKQYTLEELNDIFAQIAPQDGLLVPLQPPVRSSRTGGPAICVYLRYSDIATGTLDVEGRYWEALQRTPVLGALGELAAINGILSEQRTGDREVHRLLNERFFTADLKIKVARYETGGSAFAGVFNKIGCLQVMRHLILYGNRLVESAEQRVDSLGELMLLANEFIQAAPTFKSARASSLDLLLSFLPVWDVCNPRDLAYALSRMFTVLTEILTGTDMKVRGLVSKLGIDTSRIKIDELPLDDFVSVVFGLYAYGRNLTVPDEAVFDVRHVFSKVGFPPGILENLVKERALTISEFEQKLGGGKPCTRDTFVDEIRRRAFVTESLNCFRKFPFLKLDSYRALILDHQFLVELLTSGVYWSIFDSLPINRRETFRELWGRLFELYAVGLLEDFYPRSSGVLTSNLEHETCQIDALLDFGDEVLVFETKASLLTEPAKRGVNEAEFLKDFNRKFVQNEKGAPKTILQLATSCKAVETGGIRTATKPARIYPIFVSDEPAVETFFFNAFSNEIFQKHLRNGSRIQPLTVMSINELEEILPYVSENAFSWGELLRSRFDEAGVGPFSVHQAIYDLSRSKGLQPYRNQAIRNKFDRVWATISSRYKPLVAD
jgi:hypothetical protein